LRTLLFCIIILVISTFSPVIANDNDGHPDQKISENISSASETHDLNFAIKQDYLETKEKLLDERKDQLNKTVESLNVSLNIFGKAQNFYDKVFILFSMFITVFLIISGIQIIQSTKAKEKIEENAEESDLCLKKINQAEEEIKKKIEEFEDMTKSSIEEITNLVLPEILNKINLSDIFSEKTKQEIAKAESINKIRASHGIPAETEQDFIMNALELYNKKDFKQALKEIEKAIDKNPNNPIYWSNKSAILINDPKKYNEALEAVETAIKLDENYVQAWSNKSAILAKLNLPEESLEAAEKALSIEDHHSDIWSNKAAALLNLGKYKDALQFAEKSISLNETNVRGYFIIACAHYELYKKAKAKEDLDKAKENIEKTLKLEPNFISALIIKAAILNASKKYDDAIELCNNVLESDPNNIVALEAKGVALMHSDKRPEALQIFNKVIGIDSSIGSIWYNRACVYALQGKEFLADLKEAIRLNPDYKKDAKADADFKDFWDDPDFKSLVD